MSSIDEQKARAAIILRRAGYSGAEVALTLYSGEEEKDSSKRITLRNRATLRLVEAGFSPSDVDALLSPVEQTGTATGKLEAYAEKSDDVRKPDAK